MQLASPLQSCGILDPHGDSFSWLSLEGLDFADFANGGVCGACRVPGGFVLATQSTPPRLVLYNPATGRIEAVQDLSLCQDLHSLAYREGVVYVVSTGTNEIYEVPLRQDGFGEPRLYWRYPGIEYDRDLIHLNGLALSEDGVAIASCFGPRQPDGSWGSEGSVFQLDPYRVIRGALRQPHTPHCAGRQLFFAESRSHRVYSLLRNADDTWCQEQVFEVGGYARGLAYDASRLWVGLSAPRKISRSKGTPNPGVAAAAGAAIACVDLANGSVTERCELHGLGDEIYDLLILDGTEPVGCRADALAERIVSMQEMTDKLRAAHSDTQAKLEDSMKESQANRMRLQVVTQQLRTVTGSRLWRAAQLLRRLARRKPYVTEADRPPDGAKKEAARSMSEVFGTIYLSNYWGSEVSRSGTGSDLQQTEAIRATLPPLLRELGVRTMLDLPCGDFHWMSTLDLDVDYVGADVVAEMIAQNTARHANERRRFQVLDVATDSLPCVDLVFCRDLLVHFSFEDAKRAIANLKRSGSTWLLTTTFADRTANFDIETGQWRALNLQLPPFDFPPPMRMINENCTEGGGTDWADKSLGLWRLADL